VKSIVLDEHEIWKVTGVPVVRSKVVRNASPWDFDF
jgi:hypothetical protein